MHACQPIYTNRINEVTAPNRGLPFPTGIESKFKIASATTFHRTTVLYFLKLTYSCNAITLYLLYIQIHPLVGNLEVELPF